MADRVLDAPTLLGVFDGRLTPLPKALRPVNTFIQPDCLMST